MGVTVTVGVAVHVLQQALQLAATTDPLTGLVNRRAFEPILAANCTAAPASVTPSAW